MTTPETELLPFEEIAEKILDVADYFQTCSEKGIGYLESRIVDPLMFCHGALLDHASKNHCNICGYTKEDAETHGDHALCSNKNPPWRTTPTDPQRAEAVKTIANALTDLLTASDLLSERHKKFSKRLFNEHTKRLQAMMLLDPALQSPQAETPRPAVKPLVFVQEEDLKTSYVASTPFGNEYITALDSGKFHYNNYDYETLAEAKAAAEAHWQQKIGECLGQLL